MPQTRRCAFQLHLALHETGFFLIKLTTVLAHAPHSRTEPAKILSVPPDNKPTLAHSALLSWLGCHLPRQWRLGARDFWFAGSRSLSFPSSQILRQISQPYYWLYTFFTSLTLTLNPTNTGVSRHHLLTVIYLRSTGPWARRAPPPPPRGDGRTGYRPFPLSLIHISEPTRR